MPGGVTSIHVVAIGGAGGVGGGNGGFGAKVTADLSVTPGQTLYIEVGGTGKDSGAGGGGGFNTGGAGGGGAGGGGGDTDVRTVPLASGLSPDLRLLVAGGGGGGGGTAGGAGGAGGSAEEAGEEGVASGNQGGGGGSQIAGGGGGLGAGGGGGEGNLGLGGAGGSGESGTNSGGGGGGGYFGGGGGSGGLGLGGGGGGGGSSLVPAGGSLAATGPDTPPEVQLTYTLVPPSIAIASPAGGATYQQGQSVTASYSCTPPEGTTVKTCAGPVANGAALDTGTPGPHTFTVEAEDVDGGKATKEVGYTVIPKPIEVVDAFANTTLDSHPKAKLKTRKKKAKVSFSFSSTTPDATFKCKLDKGAFAPCTSPKTYKVKPGKHTFSVEAVGGFGTDPTPATFSFKVKKKS